MNDGKWLEEAGDQGCAYEDGIFPPAPTLLSFSVSCPQGGHFVLLHALCHEAALSCIDPEAAESSVCGMEPGVKICFILLSYFSQVCAIAMITNTQLKWMISHLETRERNNIPP